MILLFGSQKGGCGKSTLAINVAVELVRLGKDVVLVDADRQGTANNWVADRAQNGLPPVHCVQKYDNIRDTLLDLADRYEFVVVDTAGRDSRELRTGMTACDVLVVPFRPSQADLDTLHHLVDVAVQAKDINEQLVCKAVLTLAPTNMNSREAQEGREYIQEFPELELLRTFIHDRKVYRDAISEGKGVIEMDNPKAKGEIQILTQEIING